MKPADGKRGAIGIGRKKASDEIWFNFIVTINETDKISGGDFKTVVSGGGLTGVFLMNDFDARIFFSISVGDFAGIVWRAIVD